MPSKPMPDRITRQMRIERDGLDEDRRSVPVVIATDAPIQNSFGEEIVLVHDDDAIDLSRADRGLPLQVVHNGRELPVGRVERIRRDGKVTRGDLRFSKTQRGQDAWQDVMDEIITDVSVGADVLESHHDRESGATIVDRWQPLEVSLVPVGADPGTGINRGGSAMYDTPDTADRRRADATERAEQIGALFAGLEGEQWVRLERDALRGSDTVDKVRDRILNELKRAAAPTPEDPRGIGRATAGEDHMEKVCTSIELALDFHLGLIKPEDVADRRRELSQSDFAGLSLREMAREYLRQRGERVAGLSAERAVDRALRVPAIVRTNFSHSTSDFAELLAASADKSLAAGYAEAPETFRVWTRNVTMSNFRSHAFPVLSQFGDLDLVREGEEFKAGTFSDKQETAQLKTYGKRFPITRQAIINDDLNAFTAIPRKMGRAAARQVGDLVYSVLTTNANMLETGRALFNTTDGNLAASGGAISTTTLDARTAAMKKRTDPSGATLNIQPSFLLVPVAKEVTARVQIASEKDPAEGTTTSFDAPNPFRNRFQVVAEPRLDADSATAWYLLATPGAEVDTVVVGWLNGRQEPFLDQMDGWTVDGIEYKVRIDCTAAALDWRGMDKNPGA